MFRDQSSNVIRKAKAAEAKKSSSSPTQSEKSSRESTPAEDLEIISRRWDPIFSVGPTVDERATCYFIFHYLVGIQAPSRGVLDNLLLLYQTNSIDENLLTAVKAVSYASYAHHTQSTDLTEVSTYQYTKAVTLTNAALRSNSDAAKDTTLMSVMILSMYEILTGNTQRGLEAWMEHIRGSAALVKLRGEAQLKTPQGRRLFVQASIGILTSCVQLNIRVPQCIERLIRKMPAYLDVNDDFIHLTFAIHLTMIEVNQFRAEVHKGHLSDLHDILSQALELDAKLLGLLANPPPEFRYYTLEASESDIAYGGTYHVYFDLLTANLWNSVRVFRILLHEQIRDTVLKGLSTNPPTFTKREHTSQLQRSMDTCYELQAGILCSVPQHLGYVGDTNISSHANSQRLWGTHGAVSPETFNTFGMPTPPNEFNDLVGADIRCSPSTGIYGSSPRAMLPLSMQKLAQKPDIRASGGYNLMWPLWLAGSMDVTTEEVKAYAVKVMHHIGREMGIQTAFMLAHVIDNKEVVIDAWQNREKYELKEED